MTETVTAPPVIRATGRRKTSVARVRLLPGTGKITVNKKTLDDYFAGHFRNKEHALKPIKAAALPPSYDLIADVHGGGITGQAGALHLGFARILSLQDEKLRRLFRKEGFLTRDSRMVERKKPGQPKARKRYQYSKR